jgi:restriction system protein
MAIPTYEQIMLPLLKIAGDKQEHSIRQVVEKLAADFQLSNQEKRTLLPSGKEEIFANRVGWARTYLKKAELVEITRWGYFKATDRGLDLLKKNPAKIDTKFLYAYKGFKDFITPKQKIIEDEHIITESPVEMLENAYQNINNNLAAEILQQLKAISPNQFENIVIELLVNMGYGGNRKDAAEAVGGVGDEGIDGIIKEDRLGLDTIYIQAKRWDSFVVGRPEIQKFAGALQGQKAKKGIFITTSTFTNEATDYCKLIDNKIILIDGNQLAQLMINFNVGVSTESTYVVKKIDRDYFGVEQ